MRKLMLFSNYAGKKIAVCTIAATAFVVLSSASAFSQCEIAPGSIIGSVFDDFDFDGQRNEGDAAVSNVLVNAFNNKGELAGSALSDYFGNYTIDNLTEDKSYRIEFSYGSEYKPISNAKNNSTSVQFKKAPACGVDFGLISPRRYCADTPQLALTCFVKGGEGENETVETLINTQYHFDENSRMSKFAMKNETGSIWGLTWKSSTRELFSSAFVKQYADLTIHGHDAIFRTGIDNGTTSLFTKLSDLGVETGTLTVEDHQDCSYGAQTGKIGLGGLEISEDESELYVVNIYNNSLVRLSSRNPSAETTVSYKIPDPSCFNGDSYRAFAITKNAGKIYVGVTCTSEESGAAGELSVTVFEFDPETATFINIFSSDFPRGYWKDYPAKSTKTAQWLTDLAFTDDGNIVLALSDRISHRYCNGTTGRLDDQHPDILMVWNNNGTWELESGGVAGPLTGSHNESIDGPGNGEFFGYDYWVSGSVYHSEIATGSVVSLPGTGSVVATVFDPSLDSYTGGMHRYSTYNGSKLGVAIAYEHSNDPQFGKASGLGDLVAMCGYIPLEIGNLMWIDENANGVQDADEALLPNIELSLYDSNCEKIAQTTTDEDGGYYFNNSNVSAGISLGASYYVVITDSKYDVAASMLKLDREYQLTNFKVGFGANAEMNDSDAELNEFCGEFEGMPAISVKTGGSGHSDHNYDFGFVVVPEFEVLPEAGELIDAEIASPCICLANASQTEIGQFGEIVKVVAPSNETWYVEQAAGIYDAEISGMSTPEASDFSIGIQYDLVEFLTGPNGYTLAEFPLGNDTSEYYLTAIRLDNVPYQLVLRSSAGDQSLLNIDACTYQSHDISGNVGACEGAILTYCIDNFDPNSINQWEILSGDASLITSDDQECVDVQFGATLGDVVDIVFTETNQMVYVDNLEFGNLIVGDCYSPAMFSVTIGESGGFMSCMQGINVSLNNLCDIGLTPEALLTSEMGPYTVYSLAFTDASGTMIPEDADWTQYVGQEVVAKVMDQCSGNSCWAFVNIEDKKAPVIECFDLTISCLEMGEYNGPFSLDNCSGEGELIQTNEFKEPQDCDPDFSFIITRSYKAVDAYGNTSPECTQTLSVERPDLEEIVRPSSYTVANDNPLSCDGFATDENGNPDPITFGVPTLDGVPLYPPNDQFCNLGVAYQDVILPTNDCVQKVMRTWTIFEWWCTFGEMDTLIQVFNIADMESPEITCPANMDVSSNGATCAGDVELEPAIVMDDCSEDLNVDINFEGGFLDNSNGGDISLPIGTHDVIYTVYDDCFNSSSCTMQVTVSDRTAPVAVCHQNTVVSLNAEGISYAYASTFDDGSFDDCGFDRMEVRRMDRGAACDIKASNFADKVDFCCSDVGQDVVVVLRVWDLEGNRNECMVNVEVQDKNPPSITCPESVVIDCQYEYNIQDLSEFGSASASDNCEVSAITETFTENISACRTGTIVRTFRAADANGSAACQQVIFVENDSVFNGDNITWPLDYVTNEGCSAGSLLPEDLESPYDYPTFTEGFCAQVGISYSDRVFKISGTNGACQKIVRSWVIDDNCQPLDDNTYETWSYDQTITISNEVAPTITSLCDDVTVCSFNENCSTGPITLTSGAQDDCTPGDMLNWSYSIDFDIDGIADITANGKGDTVTVDGEYPIGSHSIIWEYEDICGNRSSCTQRFTIENCVGPQIVCIQGLAVALEPMDTDNDNIVDNEMAIVCARMLDQSSSHPCGQELTFSFTDNPADSCMTFNCNDIGVQDVTIYTFDETGRIDLCETTIEVQDNNLVDICRGVEECIEMPEDITIATCVADTDPATINSMPIIDPDCICTQYELNYTDTDISTSGSSCMVIERVWDITFTCGFPKTFNTTQTITILNSVAPTISCPNDLTVASSGTSCNADVIVGLPTVGGDDCSTGVTITNNSIYADSNTGAASGNYPVGLTTVIYTVTDACDNSSTCEIDILVTDGTDPICATNDITISIIDATINVTIDVADIDNSSSDECGSIVNRVVSPNSFGCDDAGADALVTLTVTDDSGNASSCDATVTILDGVAPICRAKDTNIRISVPGTFTVPVFLVDDESSDLCGEIADIVLNPSSFSCADLGMNDVTVTVTDESGNSSTCVSVVNVTDEEDPICSIMDITVQLDGADQATIAGADLDNGSSDGCSGIGDFSVTPSVFNCDDVGVNDVTVTVSDLEGNTSSCVAVVTVESNPTLVCIAQDVTVYLDQNGEADIIASDVNNGSGIPCAADVSISVSPSQVFCNDTGLPKDVTLTVTGGGSTITCSAMVTVIDTIIPVVTCPVDMTINCQDLDADLTVYGSPVVTGNCSVLLEDITETAVFTLDDCGVGVITRTFDAVDINDNGASCTQTLTVINPDPFEDADITWPTDTIRITECISIHPDTLDSNPVVSVSVSSCSNVSVDFDDVSLTNNINCQDTVSRTWTVIDSCQLVEGTGSGIFTFEQTIIVNDEMAPIIVAIDTIEECFSDIVYIVEATDCNDVTISNDSQFATASGADISGSYPEGETVVRITATDRCGNEATDSIIVNIILDTEPPNIICINRNIVIEEDGVTEVTAADGDWYFSVTDNKTDSVDLMYSLDRDFLMDTLFFNCDSAIVKSHTIMLYVKDEAGNIDSCLASYITTDPNGVCTAGLAGIQGQISTEAKLDIPDVKVNLVNGDTYEMTNNNGYYVFPEMDGDNVYELKPQKLTNVLEGVTTLDLVLIQRHILGLNPLNSSYKMIAADINRSGTITASDILDLKKNILGMLDAFPNNTSWRFVDEDYSFIDAENPLRELFPESYMIYDLNAPIYKNFVGVKIGDINGSIQMQNSSVVRNNEIVAFEITDQILEKGNTYQLPIKVSKDYTLAGMELSFILHDQMIINGIESEILEVTDNDFNISYQDGKQVIQFVNVPQEFMNVRNEEVVLELSVTAESTMQLSKALTLNANKVNEWYDKDLATREVTISYKDDFFNVIGDQLLQNTPNPWLDKTTIAFKLASNQQITLNIYDITGKLVNQSSGVYEAGTHNIELSKAQFNESGVYYYELITETSRISKRMILLE